MAESKKSKIDWLILGIFIVVVIGILWYFGDLKPDSSPPWRCQLSSGIACVEFYVGPDGASLEIRNMMGKDIRISSISLADQNGSLECRTQSTLDAMVHNDETMIAVLNTSDPSGADISPCSLGEEGKIFRGYLAINYTAEGYTAEKIHTGQIIVKLSPPFSTAQYQEHLKYLAYKQDPGKYPLGYKGPTRNMIILGILLILVITLILFLTLRKKK